MSPLCLQSYLTLSEQIRKVQISMKAVIYFSAPCFVFGYPNFQLQMALMLVLYPRMDQTKSAFSISGSIYLKTTTTTSQLRAKTGNEDDWWFLMTGTVHCGLMRQADQWGTSTLANMKYEGRISRRLSWEPYGAMIHGVRSQAKAHTQTSNV